MKKNNNEKKKKNNIIYIYIYIYIYIIYINYIYKPRKIYKHRRITRGCGKPYINIYIYIYFGSSKKQKGRGVFGKLLKTFAALILDILPIWEEKITM